MQNMSNGAGEKEGGGNNSPRSSGSNSPDIFENEFSDDESKTDNVEDQKLNSNTYQQLDSSESSALQRDNVVTPDQNDTKVRISADDEAFIKDREIETDSEPERKTSKFCDIKDEITLDDDDDYVADFTKKDHLTGFAVAADTKLMHVDNGDEMEAGVGNEDEMEAGQLSPMEDSDTEDDDMTAAVYEALAVFDWTVPADLVDKSETEDFQFSPKRGQRSANQRRMREKIINALRTKQHKTPRIFHSKSNPGREATEDGFGGSVKKQMMGFSPLIKIMNIAKTMKIDVTKMLESAETLGLPLSFPCMQCFEKQGYGGKGGDPYGDDDYYGYGRGYGKTKDGKCQKCGGSVLTLSTYRQMILKMRERLQAQNLVVHDVYPDGNCLFGAVIDQLRVRGDFRFTISTLRQRAVDYLRDNPESDDGTPYIMFLTDETWEDYLLRMSMDGVWGDHMILNAISTVVDHQLIIYGGMVGDGETIISPKGFRPSAEDEETREGSGSGSLSESGAESGSRPALGLDPLYLGHFGESHYISLRHADWKDRLQDRIHNCRTSGSELCVQPLQELSQRLLPGYCDSLLKTLFLLEYITNFRGDAMDVLSPGREENRKFVYEMMGSLINKIQPSLCEIESLAPDIELLFPGSTEAAQEKKKPQSRLVLFCTPTDSKVVFNPSNARKFDLICDRTELEPSGQMKLIPNHPELWNSVLVRSGTGSVRIKTFEVGEEPRSSFPVLDDFPDIEVNPVIAFRCRWPEEAFEWISRQRSGSWLDDDFIRTVVTGYCHVVPVLNCTSLQEITEDFASPNEDDGQTWVISFASAEKKLLQKMTPSQLSCFLLLQLYLSSLSTQLPSSVAKSAFFYACENIEASVWDVHPGVCFLKIMQNLAQGLEERLIPHFFVATKNLVHNLPREVTFELAKKLRNFCSQPFVGLFFFLDQFNITTSEVGPFLDGIAEDIFQEENEKDEESFFLKVLLPSLSTMLEGCTMQGEYRDAQLLANLTKQEILRFSGDDLPLPVIINSVIPDIRYVGFRWCLALYMDLSNGTRFTNEVNEDMPTISITEIFGPECTEELPDTNVCTGYRIQSGDLYFPTHVHNILRDLGKDRAITKCIRYYLDTLKDVAGDKMVIGTANSCGHQGKYACMCSIVSMQQLSMLYVYLFNAYLRVGCMEEFRDLVPTLTQLTDAIQTPNCYRNLSDILYNLKDYEKADEVANKIKGTPASMPAMLSSALRTLSSGSGSGSGSGSRPRSSYGSSAGPPPAVLQMMAQLLTQGPPPDLYDY